MIIVPLFPVCNNFIAFLDKFFARRQRAEHVKQRRGGQMLRQCQRAQQRGALRFAPRADQAEVKKVRVCNGIFLYGRSLSLKGCV